MKSFKEYLENAIYPWSDSIRQLDAAGCFTLFG